MALAILPVTLDTIPRPHEGSKACLLSCAWTDATTTQFFNLLQQFQSGQFTTVQACLVDNTPSQYPITIRCNDTGFVLVVPAYTQGMFPLLCGQQPGFTVTLQTGGLAVGAVFTTSIWLLNTPQKPWAVASFITAPVSNRATVWTLRQMPVVKSWIDMLFVNNLFTALATDGTIAQSSDGISWTIGSIGAGPASGWVSLAYGNGIYIAANNGPIATAAATSANGINWTIRSTQLGAILITLKFGNGAFVGTSSSNTGSFRTIDGVTWTAQGGPGQINEVLVYGSPPGFVSGSASATMVTSSDGITWTASSFAWPTTFTATRCTFGNGVFVASGAAAAAYSFNPATSGFVAGNPPGTLQLVFFGHGLFLGANAGIVYTAADGATWSSAIALPTASVFWSAGAYGTVSAPGNDGRFVMLGNSQFYVTSP